MRIVYIVGALEDREYWTIVQLVPTGEDAIGRDSVRVPLDHRLQVGDVVTVNIEVDRTSA
jgi:hypothetical protein